MSTPLVHRQIVCCYIWTHNTFGDRSFAAARPRLWNSLPVHLRDEDITVFGVNSKSFGFNVASGAQCDIPIYIVLYKYSY